jgi:alkanesulfonate monooxygenase SsuD/methylene tetrahydromethanopterin reductase-like flavin-dependent oxidoreductase (luciferase family)
MRYGLDIAQQRMSWSENASRARFADELGFDGIWGFDHFQPMYGDGPGECFEGNTTLAAWSGITTRVRLGLLVTGMTYRHPAVFAAEAITIDHASNGRLELSYGAAWFDEEHHNLGIPFPVLRDRIDAFEEAVQILRGLLTTDGAPSPRPAAAPADLDRRVGGEADDADRGPLRRRVALLRPGRGPRCEVSAVERACRAGRSRSRHDHAGRVALTRR